MEEKVFGLPAGLLANSMIVILVAISIILLFGGLRRFILVKMGTRNIPRRKGQSTLIVMGLMLSSIIVAVSLGIGDTVRYSVRSVVFDSAGNIDETIDGPGKQLFGVEYISYSEFDNVEKLVSTNKNIDGIMPYIEIDLPAENDNSGIAESRVQVRGYNPKYTDSFDEIRNINNELVNIESLSSDQVYINVSLSKKLKLNKGDTIGVYINLEKKEFKVNDVLESGSIAGANITPTISFKLSVLQSLLGKENMITNIAISNSGNQDESLELSDDVTQFLRLNLTNKQVANKFFEILSSNEIPTLIKEEAKSLEQTDSETFEELTRIASDLESDNFNEEFITSVGDYQLQLIILGALDKAGLQAEAAELLMMFGDLTTLRVDDSKNNGVKLAETVASGVTTIFSIFGSFSIMVGMLLIFLVFVLLAAARSTELGMARAIVNKSAAPDTKLLPRRAIILLGAQMLTIGVLGWRMRKLQIEDSERYRLLAEENRVNIRIIPPRRGLVFDNKGNILAHNQQNYRIVIIREEAKNSAIFLDNGAPPEIKNLILPPSLFLIFVNISLDAIFFLNLKINLGLYPACIMFV